MAKFVTVGIAGHVDHGKTTLAKCLAGTDGSLLDTAGERHTTAETAILPFDWGDCVAGALMDVPGHIRFIKNTIRSLSNVDFALLVVAADDGVMPQTRQHLMLIDFLGIRHGLIVLSKTDLVDAEILELARLDVEEALKGTSLAGWPFVLSPDPDGTASSVRRVLKEIVAKNRSTKNGAPPFKMWIDRVCRFTGHGTVVCGTVQAGSLAPNAAVQLLPAGKIVRARSLEVHRKPVDRVEAGHQAGINLPKIGLQEVANGMCLAQPDTLEPVRMANARLRVARSAGRGVENHMRVVFFSGTAFTEAHIVLMDGEPLSPGRGGWAQIRFKRPLPVSCGERFVIMPLWGRAVLAGGEIVEPAAIKFRASKAVAIQAYLSAWANGDYPKWAVRFLAAQGGRPQSPETLVRHSGFSPEQIAELVSAGIEAEEIIALPDGRLLAAGPYAGLKKRIAAAAGAIMSEDLLKETVFLEEIRNRETPDLDKAILRHLLEELCRDGLLERHLGGYRPQTYPLRLLPQYRPLAQDLDRFMYKTGLVPFSLGHFCNWHEKDPPKKDVAQVVAYLIKKGDLIQIDREQYLSTKALEAIKSRLRRAAQRKAVFTLSDCKEILGYGRNKGAAIFDYLDTIGFTCRCGNQRMLNRAASDSIPATASGGESGRKTITCR